MPDLSPRTVRSLQRISPTPQPGFERHVLCLPDRRGGPIRAKRLYAFRLIPHCLVEVAGRRRACAVLADGVCADRTLNGSFTGFTRGCNAANEAKAKFGLIE